MDSIAERRKQSRKEYSQLTFTDVAYERIRDLLKSLKAYNLGGDWS